MGKRRDGETAWKDAGGSGFLRVVNDERRTSRDLRRAMEPGLQERRSAAVGVFPRPRSNRRGLPCTAIEGEGMG